MQRSRRALLQRRALENALICRNQKFYKVSLSLVVVFWGLLLLLNLWISHGDSHGDGSGELVQRNGSHSRAEFSFVDGEFTESDTCKTSTTNSRDNFCSSESQPVNQEAQNDLSPKDEQIVMSESIGVGIAKQEKDGAKNDRLSRAVPLGLDEFKSKAISTKGKPVTGQVGSVTHRLETSGVEYNYASSAKGAKVLASNKEAKGAPNILGKDQDKYLRNPCSADEKFVVIELSEETLVDTIEIANFEHHSSNLKDFELLGSMVYPNDRWVSLGNFTAGNVKHAQRFVLPDPKWVRYLKLNLLSHYGSEFYCTLSFVEVYGVDAVERMLEDLISFQDKIFAPEEPMAEQTPITAITQVEPNAGDELYQDLVKEVNNEAGSEHSNVKYEVTKVNVVPNPVLEARPQQPGRMPGDTVLKILMQKVRSLDLNLSLLERYLEELNSRYGNIFKELDNEVAEKDVLLEKIRTDVKHLADANEFIVKDVADLVAWKSLVSLQLNKLVKDNAILRSEVETVKDYQARMENKGAVIVLISFIFGCVAVTMLFVDLVLSLCRTEKSRKFCGSWLILLLSCTTIVLIIFL